MKVLVVSMSLIVMLSAVPLQSHCDSIKGPVVVDAQKALETKDPAIVLKWVSPAKEQEIREAFARTLAVRGQSTEAKKLADRWFFETLVRVHREGEGAAFTGLKGAEFEPEEGIELADRAIASGSLEGAEQKLRAEVTAGLRKRYREVREAKEHPSQNLESGRHFVQAYVEFIHYVERLHESATTSAGHHAATAAAEPKAEHAH